MISTFAKKALVAGAVILVGGIGGSIAGTMPPPRDLNLSQTSSQLVSRLENLSSGTNGFNSSTTHSSGGTDRQSHLSTDSSSRQEIIQTVKNRHCIVLLKSSNSNQNYQILVCDDSEQHQDFSDTTNLISKNWYLYDSNKNTFNEISGFLIQNVNSRAGGYGNGRLGRTQDGYPLPSQRDSFGKRPKGVPYFENSRGIDMYGVANFDLSVISGTSGFPYWSTLNKNYLGKCGGGASRSCSYFKLQKSELTNLTTKPQVDKEKVCFNLQQSSGNKGKKKEGCQSERSK